MGNNINATFLISAQSSAMDSLPEEILERILKLQLEADGRHLWRLRILSSRWRNLIDCIIWKNPLKMYKYLPPRARTFLPGCHGRKGEEADFIHCWSLLRRDLMACLASEPCPLRVYDYEYVEAIDSGGRCESPLKAGEMVNLWHDASFEIRHKPNRIITWSFDDGAKSSKVPWEVFYGNVTAWRYHLGLLAIGTNNGRMAVYHARSDTELLNIDLRRPLWMKNSVKWLKMVARVVEIRQSCKGKRVRFLFMMECGRIWEFGLSLFPEDHP